jgi:ribonuclease HII
MTKKQRQTMKSQLGSVCEFGEGWVSANEIDSQGLAAALRTGIARALAALKADYSEEIMLDGKVNYVDPKFINAECLIDADALIPIVSAAGIYAKVRRDEYMVKLRDLHPAYGFEHHVGYGTASHRLAIVQNGILEGVNRLSFKPVKLLAGLGPGA